MAVSLAFRGLGIFDQNGGPVNSKDTVQGWILDTDDIVVSSWLCPGPGVC